MGRITLKDIAREVGTSPATVSRVINKNDMKAASPETIQHILTIMSKMGYNAKAKLSANSEDEIFGLKSNGVGVVLCSPMENKYTHSYYSEIYFGIKEALFKENYNIEFYYTIPEIGGSQAVYDSVFSSSCDKLILLDEFNIIDYAGKSLANYIKAKFKNIISVSINYNSIENDLVYVDSYKSVRDSIQKLIDSGRRNILLMGGNSAELILDSEVNNNYFLDSRFIAYKDAVLQNGLRFDKSLVHDAQWMSQLAYSKLDNAIKDRVEFDAIFAADDMMAISCLKALHDNHISVPDDVALIGFDDLEVSSFSHPSISTIHVPRRELGRIAAQILMLRSTDRISLPMKVLVPTTFIIRESCGLKTNG